MAGYSGTPLPRKLGLKPGGRLGLVRPPTDFGITLGPLPDGAVSLDASRGKGPFDVIVCFMRTLAELGRDVPALKAKLDPAGGLWVAWAKKASKKASKKTSKTASRKSSGVVTDVTEALVRQRGLATGLVDNKVCAIDDVWSGLRFVVRVADRPKPRKTTQTT